MKWIFGRTAMWIWATFAVATMAFAATQDLPEGDGKKILQTSCTACHGLDSVTSLHMDKAGWEGLVSSMISNGAAVDTKDFPVLVDYLVKNYGPAKPAGQAPADSANGANAANDATGANGANDDTAKKLLNDVCTACHDLDLVADQHLSKDDWQSVVGSMVAKGASLETKDVPVLVEYLAKTYPPKK